jgi:hypothetical protein
LKRGLKNWRVRSCAHKQMRTLFQRRAEEEDSSFQHNST